MALEEIKHIGIREYLKQKGITPKKDYGYYGMYHCPYREDRNASFKVDYNKYILRLWNKRRWLYHRFSYTDKRNSSTPTNVLYIEIKLSIFSLLAV